MNEIINFIIKKDYQSIEELLKTEDSPPIFSYKNKSNTNITIQYIIDYISNLPEFIDNYGTNKIVNIFDMELLIYAYDDNIILHELTDINNPAYFFYEVRGTRFELDEDNIYFRMNSTILNLDKEDTKVDDKYILENIFTHKVN